MRFAISSFLVVVSSCSPPPCSTCLDGGAGGSAIGGGLTASNGGSAGGQGGGSLGGGNSGGAAAGGGTTAGGMAAGGTTAGGDTAGGTALDAGTDAGVPCPTGSVRIVQAGPLDLPPAAPGCVSRKRVAIVSTCDRPQVASLSFLPSGGPFSSLPTTLTIPPGGAADVTVEFAPTTLGPRVAQLILSAGSNTNTLAVRALASIASQTDSFSLPARPTADVLLVVSDGQGMAAPQQALANDFAGFIRSAVASAVDFRIGVVRGAADAGLVRQGNEPLFLTPVVPNLANAFSNRVQLGASGTPTSSCLKRAAEALAIDSTWLRPNGDLGILCMQNTFEDAPGSIGGWVEVARSFTNGRLTINAHANFLPCAGSEDLQLRAAASETFGATSSICGPLAEAASQALFGFSTSSTYPLSRQADQDGGFTLEIDGMAVPPTDPRGQGVWRYDATSNAVIFEPLYVPEPGKRVSIQYGARCQ